MNIDIKANLHVHTKVQVDATHIKFKAYIYFEASNPKGEVHCVQVKSIHSKNSIHKTGSKNQDQYMTGYFQVRKMIKINSPFQMLKKN
jgi:hypothetical protein